MLWNHLNRCLLEHRFSYGFFNVTPVAKYVQIRLNKEVKKNICHSLLPKFIDLCLEKSEIILFKGETGIIFNRKNSCCEYTFIYYVIFINNSLRTLFFQLSHTVWNFRSCHLRSTNTFSCRKHPLSTVKSGGHPALISSFFENLLYKGYCMKDTNKKLMTRASNLKQQEHAQEAHFTFLLKTASTWAFLLSCCVKYFLLSNNKYSTLFSGSPRY